MAATDEPTTSRIAQGHWLEAKEGTFVQVRKLLQSAKPTPIHIKNAANVADAELSALQQKRLMALAVRTMALPTGRAALTLGGRCLIPISAKPLYKHRWLCRACRAYCLAHDTPLPLPAGRL